MTEAEMRQWLVVTENSRYQWTEDEVTRLNGRGVLYCCGGEDSVYMHIQPEGTLLIATYEGALLHIGEALLPEKKL